MPSSNIQIIYTPPPVLYKNTINEKECVEKTELDIFNALNFIISAANNTVNIDPKIKEHISGSVILSDWLNTLKGLQYFSTVNSPKIKCDDITAISANNYIEDNLIKALYSLNYCISAYSTSH